MKEKDEDEKVKERLLPYSIPNNTGQKFDLPEDTARKFTRAQKQILTLLIFGDFVCFCALSVLGPIFPVEVSKKLTTLSASSLVFGVYAFVIFIVSPFMGNLAGRIEAKLLLALGLGLVGYSNFLLGFSEYIPAGSVSFTIFAICTRIMTALGAAAYTASSFMFIAHVFPDDVGTVMAFIKIGVGFGTSLGPALGGLLYDSGGFGLPFFIFGTIILIYIPLSLIILPHIESEASGAEEKQSFCSVWKLLCVQPAIILISIIVVVIASSWSFLDPTLEPHLRKFKLPSKYVGLFFSLMAGTFTISGSVAGYIVTKMTRTWILVVIGLILSTVALLLLKPSEAFGLENTIWVNVAALALLGISISIALLPTFEALLEFAIEAGCKDDLATYGLIGGLWASMYSLGETIGPVLGGLLTEFVGFSVCTALFAIITFFSAIAVIVHFGISYQEKSKVSEAGSKENSVEYDGELEAIK